jgi:hypothetical protein
MRSLTLRYLAGLAVMALVAAPVAGQAAGQPCLTSAEFTALSNYALPSIITGTTQRCAASLPADAWLRRNGNQLAARYAAAKPAAWPAAKSAFLKLGGNGANNETAGLIRSLPDNSQQQMADLFIAGLVSQRLPIDRCGVIDRLVRLLAPLPQENTAELIALAAGLAAKTGRARLGDLRICSA